MEGREGKGVEGGEGEEVEKGGEEGEGEEGGGKEGGGMKNKNKGDMTRKHMHYPPQLHWLSLGKSCPLISVLLPLLLLLSTVPILSAFCSAHLPLEGTSSHRYGSLMI